jgi:tRNA (mo5U34)-methyltransferase
LWAFIEKQLDKIDFAGKTVLDLGCWDGYWSFYAERRGAAHVLATDDQSQNWARSSGLLLAKQLLRSSVETRLDVSVYDLAKVEGTFDIIFCMGIYYHLVDPFYAFTQVRHRCHPDSIVVFEGDISEGLRPNTNFYDLSNHSVSIFVPTVRVLNQMLGAAYFEVVSQERFIQPEKMRKRTWRPRLRLRMSRKSKSEHSESIEPLAPRLNRMLTVCRPITTANKLHMYRPPFGLHRYDDRFVDETGAKNAS